MIDKMSEKELVDKLVIEINYFYGRGDINYWGFSGTYEQKQEVRKLATKIAKFIKTGDFKRGIGQ